MIKIIRKLLGYKEAVVVKRTLDVKRGYRKAYGISWRNVWYNFVQLLKSWPRKGSYRKFYYHNYTQPPNVLGYIDMGNVKAAVKYDPKHDSFARAYLHGHIYPDLQDKTKF